MFSIYFIIFCIRFNSLPIYWDDNNTANGDGWNSTWNIETGWTCKGGSFSSSDSWTEIWGDGVRFNTLATYCDDGNTIDNDGWSSSCQVESRYAWSGGNSTAKDIWAKTISAQEEDAIKTLQIIAIIGATISSGTSLLTMSSPIGIFSMINQYQLLFLLLICGVYLSNGVKSLIIGMEISLINFEFIKLENASIIISLLSIVNSFYN